MKHNWAASDIDDFSNFGLEDHKIWLKALNELSRTDCKWVSNCNTFFRWTSAQRSNWVAYIERQAEQGLPMARKLITKVIELRMTT